MLGLTKKRRQADMRKSGPSGKRRARFFAAHRYRKSGPRKTALTGLRKKKNDCRYIDDTGACITPEARGGGLPPFKGIGRRSWKGHGESKEEARKGQGGSTERARKEHGEGTERPQKTGRGSKEGQERLKRAGWRGKEPAGGGGRTGWRGEVPIEVHGHKKTGALIGRRYVAR